MGSFSQDISVFVQKTKLKADVVLRKLAFDGFTMILLRSPVDTGRFRSSWRVGIDNVDLSVEDPRDSVKYASNTPLHEVKKAEQDDGLIHTHVDQSQLEGLLQNATFGQTIYISNNVPYAEVLELGSSKQAPSGVLEVSFLELTSNFAAAVASV